MSDDANCDNWIDIMGNMYCELDILLTILPLLCIWIPFEPKFRQFFLSLFNFEIIKQSCIAKMVSGEKKPFFFVVLVLKAGEYE